MNESTIAQLASEEVSFGSNWYDKCDEINVSYKDSWHVEMGLEFGNIGIYMVFTSIYPFYVVNPFAN